MVNELGRFKQIADEINKHVVVHEVLKERVRARCRSERRTVPYKALLPAACMVLILAVAGLFGNPASREMPRSTGPENITMMSTEIDAAKEAGWDLAGLDEAEASFGPDFRVPAHMPEGYAIASIRVLGEQKAEASGIVLNYAWGDKLITILQERGEPASDWSAFRKRTSEGRAFYVMTTLQGSIEKTELHWFSGGIHYAVMGLIIEEEAVSIALSMK